MDFFYVQNNNTSRLMQQGHKSSTNLNKFQEKYMHLMNQNTKLISYHQFYTYLWKYFLSIPNIVCTKARKGQTTVLKYRPFVATPRRSSGIAIDDVRSWHSKVFTTVIFCSVLGPWNEPFYFLYFYFKIWNSIRSIFVSIVNCIGRIIPTLRAVFKATILRTVPQRITAARYEIITM